MLPIMFNGAKGQLAIAVSSSKYERTFSKSGKIVTVNRSSLSPTSVEILKINAENQKMFDNVTEKYGVDCKEKLNNNFSEFVVLVFGGGAGLLHY